MLTEDELRSAVEESGGPAKGVNLVAFDALVDNLVTDSCMSLIM